MNGGGSAVRGGSPDPAETRLGCSGRVSRPRRNARPKVSPARLEPRPPSYSRVASLVSRGPYSRHFDVRTCSSRKTPFLFDVTISSRPSPLKSATTNWVPIPLWSSISRGVNAIPPSDARRALNQ